MLRSLDVLVRDSDEESITVIQPGGDKGVDELLCICQREFGDVPEVVESCLTEVFEVSWGSILPHRLVTDVERKMF